MRLQPWRWIPDQQAWTPATDAFHENHRQADWWHYPLPGTLPAPNTRSPVTPEVPAPKGWSVAKTDDLNQHCAPLTPDAALRFVDALSQKEVWVLKKGTDGFSVIRHAADDATVGSMVEQGLPLGGLWYSDYLDAR